jgi:cell division protein FtsB
MGVFSDPSLVIQFLTFVATGVLGWLGANMYAKLDEITKSVHRVDLFQTGKFSEHEARIRQLEKEVDDLEDEIYLLKTKID